MRWMKVNEWYAVSDTGWRCRKYRAADVYEDGVFQTGTMRYQLYRPDGRIAGPSQATFEDCKQWLNTWNT